jgi:mono/diheme cytochrome c family protein
MSRNQSNLTRTFFVIGMIVSSMCYAAAQSDNNAATGDPVSGKQLYGSYCALCHGPEGKGGGPFSTQLKVWPPDLTQLARKNHGTYPEMHVTEAIAGDFAKPSHGSAEMPVWGPVFRTMAHGHKDSAHLRITNLVKYVESIQEK